MGTGAKVAIGVGAVIALGIAALAVAGMGLYEEEVCEHLQAQPALIERVGEPATCTTETLVSLTIDDLDTFIFDVTGPKGTGRVYVKSTSTGEGATEEYQGILLVMNGEETLIFGERPPTN